MKLPCRSGVERTESSRRISWLSSAFSVVKVDMCVESSSVDRIPYACSKKDLQNWIWSDVRSPVLRRAIETHMTGLPHGLCADREPLELWQDLGRDDLMELGEIRINLLKEQSVELIYLLDLS